MLLRTTILLLSLGVTAAPMALASDIGSSAKATAYAHYRCAALVQLNRMTDADAVVCDKLTMVDNFDLAGWEFENPTISVELHHLVFTEFF